ncbi:MAG: SpoIIE family protein phosphatase [Acidobacteria bacterium]|nr:SpoIIE family protein phosphatase [Acidobacteriota bacterium]
MNRKHERHHHPPPEAAAKSIGQDHEILHLKDRALDGAAEGIVISDARLPDNPLIYVNSGFVRLTGYSADEVLGRNCRFLQGPRTDPATTDAIRQAIHAERSCRVEILNHRKDGTIFWNDLSITPVRDSGGPVTHFIGIQSDITQRKNAEIALQQAKAQLENANQRMRRNLEAAAKIQQALLPTHPPEMAGVRFAWRLESCDELAGDTMNLLQLDGNLVGLYLIDVSGHGVPSSLLSFTLNHLLSPVPAQSFLYGRSESRPHGFAVLSPAEVARDLNTRFPMDMRTAQYFTLVYGILDMRRLRLRYVTAGHPPPVLLPAGGAPRRLEAAGFPIGVMPEADFEEYVLDLKTGDRILFYTDGVVDTANENDEDFGTERLLATAAQHRQASLQPWLDAIVAAVRAWSGGHPLQDDVSLLALEITGADNHSFIHL